MITIKIINNPYKKQIRFQKLSEDGSEWKNIDYMHNPNSRLLRSEITESITPQFRKEAE